MPQRLFVIALIVVAFAAFMVTYTVRFTEKAIVTTFGSASGAVKTEPGLYFKVPYIQQVTKYDSRTRFLESNQETHGTSDNSQLLVTAYMTWRIADPLKFYKAFSASGDTPREHYREAENVLKIKLRSAMGEVSRFSFGQLLSPDEKLSKLPLLEDNILKSLTQSSGTEGALTDFGIEAESVGISRIGLPAATTRAVFDRMNAERAKLANEAIAQGKAQADALRSGASADAIKITRFAERLAEQIRNQGDVEAAEWIKRLNQEPRLAIFLRQLDMMKQTMGTRPTTLVLPTSTPGLEFFRPDAMDNLKAGEIPGPNFDTLTGDGDAAKDKKKAEGEKTPTQPAKPISNADQPAGAGGSR